MFIIACILLSLNLDKCEKARSFGDLIEHYEAGRKQLPLGLFELITEYVTQEETILDIGCGTGRGTLPLIDRFCNVRGCDWDQKMLEAAELKAPGYFDHANVYSLPYQNAQFGLVTLFAAYHWFCDDAATQEIARVLKPEGYVVVCGTIEKKIDDIFYEADAIIKETLGFVVTESEGYKPLQTLKKNGFEIVRVLKFSEAQEYTIDEAVHYMQSRSSWNFLMKTQKDEIAEQRLRAFFEEVKDKDGMIRRTSSSTVIIAQIK